jgi:hypothetical protein
VIRDLYFGSKFLFQVIEAPEIDDTMEGLHEIFFMIGFHLENLTLKVKSYPISIRYTYL